MRTALLFLVLSLTTASCMKKPALDDNDGTPVTAEAVQDAVVQAWGAPSALDIGANEFAYTEKDIEIGDLPARVIFQDGKTIQSVEETPEEKKYVILQQIAEIDSNNEQKLSTSERRISVAKPSQTIDDEGPATLATALPLSVELAQQLLYACVKGKDWNVSCYNLQASETVEDAPPQIASRPDCEGLTDCKWRQKFVSFDMILESKDDKTGVTSRTKAKYSVKMSPDAPYLSRVTEFCYEGIGTVSNTHFPLRICQRIKNFRR
ncbi:MAG: hypothetical protein KF789_13045 [Bdellovibrionaceae bacterium]|nr:hypothetical protein [Pseudobdellovibrionaceae bacterium]